MAVTTIDTDDELLGRAVAGDTEALVGILERHLHPAWRIALAASPSSAAAEEIVTTGVCDALLAASRNPDPTISLRTRIAAATHAAALAAESDRGTARPGIEHSDPVVAAFLALPVASRTALWLTEVEGGEAAQVAPVLRVERGVAAALADRASASLRDRLAADAAGHATNPQCARVLATLPAHAAGTLTDERGRMGEHLASCEGCAAVLASVVAPRPALRRIVVAVPATLAGAIAERWEQLRGADGVPVARRWSERTIGAAAAGLLAVGLAGSVMLGRGGGSPTVAEFASPTPIDLSSLADEQDTTPTTAPLPTPTVPTPSVTTGGLGTAGRRGGGGSGGSGGGTGSERARGTDPTTATTTGSTPSTGSTPTTSSSPTTPTTRPPTTTTTPPTTTPPPASDGSGTEVDLPGVGTVTVGAPGTSDPILEVEITGLPPVTIPNPLP